MLPRPLVIGLAVLISIAWSVNFTVGLLYPGRSDPALNAIFALVAGVAFTQLGADKLKAARKKIASRIDPEPEPDTEPDRGDKT